MASRLSQLWFGLLAVLFTGRIVAWRTVRVDDSTTTNAVLLSFDRPERTNYSLVYSPRDRILRALLNIDSRTGVITLTRRLKCGLPYNRTFVVTVRSISVRVPPVLSFSPVVVLLSNRRCVEWRRNFLSDATSRDLIHSSLGTANSNENRIAFERKQLNGFPSPNKVKFPCHFSWKFTRTKSTKDFASRLYADGFRLRPVVMDSLRYQKSSEGMDLSTSDETAGFRARRSTRNHPPKFAKPSDRVSVGEDVKIGTVVFTVSASDPDRHSRGKVDYKMTASGNINSDKFFKLDASTGEIRTVKELDREAMERHVFRVTATDGAIPPLRATMTLTIELLDVNDHSPVFDQQIYSKNVSELVDIGSRVLAVRAHDKDAGLNKNILYSIVSNTGINDAFSISRDSGIVSVERELDREMVDTYRLVVKAEDQGNPAKSSTAEVFITLLDENDCDPVFNQSSYDFVVAENSRTGTFVGATNATDCDIGLNSKIKYSITSGNQDQAFRMKLRSGFIFVQGKLDFEKRPFYALQVTAEDSGEIPGDGVVPVLITVLDVNDCPPEFPKSEYRFTVMENAGLNYPVGMVLAQDRDSGKNRDIIYFLKAGDFPFEIESSSGNIKTKAKLDREKVPSYQLEVIAQDQGTPPLRSTVAVFITVDDVNDSPPRFTEVKYNVTIPEDFPRLQVFKTVLAKDKDMGGTIMYSVKNVPDNCFFINLFSGGLSRTCKLSFKRKKEYVFQVEASDGKQKSSADVVVTISDANDHAPRFGKSTYVASIPENRPRGTEVVQVNATDGDFGENARLSYSIVDQRKVFEIDAKTGIISNMVKLDREKGGNYKFRVFATDHGRKQKSGRAWVRITVQDVNDNAPKFVHSLYNVSLKEDVHVGFLVLQMKATDDDDKENNKITYSLEKKGNEGDMFKINPDLGDITVYKKLDRETTPQYILTVVATDHGKQPQKSSTKVKVSVEDVIDSRPSFEKSHYIKDIPENYTLKKEVIRVKATTNDTSHLSEMQYNLVSDNSDNKFIIFRSTGIIELDKHLDFETKTTYFLTVRVVYASYLDTATVQINVLDVNDMEPVLAPRFDIIINMQTGMFPHEVQFKIPAYDPDKSSHLTYHVLPDVRFNMVKCTMKCRHTGILELTESALMSIREVSFVVKVSDGRFPKVSEGSIHLNIITENLLNASVTVYLKDATTSKFFQSFRQFKKSIGNVLGVAEKDIAVFYVVNKTRRQWVYDKEVDDDFLKIDNYLTVWMAARRPASQEVYLDGKLILDKLFLNVKKLEHETGMTFLPSDEEIIKEKSSNHYLYVNEVFDVANSFVTCFTKKSFESTPNGILNTPTVLFRGLKIKEVVRPVCLPGFYGSMCNFKLDSCYSSPCVNNGKCVDAEGGYSCRCLPNFVGKNCRIDTRKSKCSAFPDNICLNKGVCRDLLKGGFECNCPSPDHDPRRLCHASARSFQNGSFAAFSGVTQNWHVQISLEFATTQSNGLLAYVGRYEHKHDFIALEIRNQTLYHIFSAGGRAETVSVKAGEGESIIDGQWKKVTISYQNQTGSIVLGYKCDSAVAVKFGKQVGNFSCAAAKRLRERFRSMDLTSPLLLGGLPFTPGKHPVQGKSFHGCIRNVFVNQAPLNLGSPIVENNTQVGCGAKKNFCLGVNPCINNGKCISLWKSAVCQCPDGFAGKTCEIKTMPMEFTQHNFLISAAQNVVIKLPWSISLMFRTVEKTGSLMQVLFSNHSSLLQLREDTLHYSYNGLNMSFPNLELVDGNWHHVEITWTVTSVRMTVDHVHVVEVSCQGAVLDGRTLTQVALGDAKKSGEGFIGCVKGVMVGGAPLDNQSATKNYSEGCSSKASCQNHVCPKERVCRESWRKTPCVCRNGYVGENCVDICSLRPCQNGATCKRMDNAVGFKCTCPDKYLGQYCEIRSQLPCRNEFYSASDSGFCGPCNCDRSLGYDPVCNKTTGYCRCKNYHYREILGQGSLGEICILCDCDSQGSKNNECASIGGQCPCLPGVIGPRCDMCKEKQGEITGNRKGCKIINTSCPRAKAEDIVWPRKKFGYVSKKKCPFGAQGDASRLCAKYVGWQKPDVSDCVTSLYLDLEKMLQHYGDPSRMTTEMAIELSNNLGNALFARKDFYQKDVAIAYKIMMALLEFESRQQEENLASSQDEKFLDTVLKAVSTFLDKKYTFAWSLIQEGSPPAVSLMRALEEFGVNLAGNIVYIRRRDNYRRKRSTSDLQSLNKIEPNLLIQLEPVIPKQFRGSSFPLEEHEDALLVSHLEWQNRTNRVYIPASLFENDRAPRKESAIAFIVLKHLGDLLPSSFDIKEREPVAELSLDVNSDVIMIGIKGMESTYLKHPIVIEFQNHEVNRSQYDCVFWNYSIPGGHGGGWSKNGCTKKSQGNETHTVCHCHHLTSFAVVSDLRIEVPVILPYSVQIVTYVGISLSLVILLVALTSFTCLSGLSSNTNSIHKNLVLAIVIAEIVYLMGINRTSNKLLCRFIAIILHFFFDAVFAWMLVEVVHMYRRLIEKRNIDSGQMTFYYFLGWGCPAIVVGLSTGMAVEGYGNEKFCWMTTDGTLIWTFTIPIIAVIFFNTIVFLMALSLSIKKSRRKKKQASYNPRNVPVTSIHKNALKIKYALKVGAAFLPVLLVTLVFAVLAINEDLLLFHYLFAFLCCCQSLFVVLFYVVFDPKVREEYKNAFVRWKTGDKNYGRPRRKRLYEMSYHPGSNLAGEDGYGIKGMNHDNTSTDRSTSTLHSTSMTRTSKTDGLSTFPDDDSDSDVKEIKKHKPQKQDPVNMESAIKMWNAPEKSEVSTTQPESSDSSDEGRRRATMVISSESGSSGDESGSWEKKAAADIDVHQKGTAPLYASDGPMHSTPLELEQEKARLLKKKSAPESSTAASVYEPLLSSKLPSILKNSMSRGEEVPAHASSKPDEEVPPSPQTHKTVLPPKAIKTGSEASSGSSLTSPSDDDMVVQAKLLSQSTEGGMSTMSSKDRKRRSRKSRDMEHGKKSRNHRVHFHRTNADGATKVRVKALHLGEGKPRVEHRV